MAHQQEQEKLEHFITEHLKDLTYTNVVRIKAGLRILMTTDFPTFEHTCSPTVQQALNEFKNILIHPEMLAPISSKTVEGRKRVVDEIKHFTLDHLNLLDKRTTILPNTYTVTRSIGEKERLKSVIHASALNNVMKAAHHSDIVEKNFKDQGLSGAALEQAVQLASEATRRLHQAVIDGNPYAVTRILTTPGIDVNYPNPEGLTLLHIAARDNQLEIVKTLLKAPGIRVNAISNNGWTALHLAARLGQTEVVKALLDVPDIQVNVVNSDGWTPLHWAAWHGHTDTVAALLSKPEIKVNLKESTGMTALHWAARNGHLDVIMLLLNTPDIQVNSADNEGRTSLHYAVEFEHVGAVAALLEAPTIEVNLPDMDGLTPLHWAARQGSIELVNMLLANPNIRPNLQDHNGMIPYDWAKLNGAAELLPILSAHLPPKHFGQRLKKAIGSLFSRPIS